MSLTYVYGIIGIIVTVCGFITIVWAMAWWMGRKVKAVVGWFKTIKSTLDKVAEEFEPNHGSTMRDQMDNVMRRLNEQDGVMEAQGKVMTDLNECIGRIPLLTPLEVEILRMLIADHRKKS